MIVKLLNKINHVQHDYYDVVIVLTCLVLGALLIDLSFVYAISFLPETRISNLFFLELVAGTYALTLMIFHRKYPDFRPFQRFIARW
jgi:hypothetical protein